MKRKSKAFTLIELLIVVAIIGILAAIAIPNFLNAQVRAKVASVKSELNSLNTALESYFVDNDAYPRDSNDTSPEDPAMTGDGWDSSTMTERYSGFWKWVSWNSLYQLTTPIEYMSSIPGDPFWDDGAPYSYDSIKNSLGLSFAAGWLVASMGPDRIIGDWPINEGALIYATWYNPINGTISEGDIWRTNDAVRRYDIDY